MKCVFCSIKAIVDERVLSEASFQAIGVPYLCQYVAHMVHTCTQGVFEWPILTVCAV